MDADLFLQQFGHLSQGEGGIKKLRDVILQLAVSGKLVKQNLADEPAEILLKNIETERKKLAKAGKIKTPKITPAISPAEIPFDLPKNWAWTRLGNLGSIFNGDSISANEKEQKYATNKSGYNYVATKDVDFLSRKINYENGVKIPFENKGFKIAHKRAVLICAEGGSAGKKIAITEEDICFGNKLYALETFTEVSPHYIFYVYQSPYFYKEFSLTTTGIIGGTSINKFNQIPVPIPPLAEQERIVAKVDELMALCDKLEAEQNVQHTLKTQAVQSTLHHLTNDENPVSFGNNLSILERTFGNWFDDLATVKHLRATILQLAVQGKLVPQNSADEPASELLKRIEAEKKRLVMEGKIKKSSLTDHKAEEASLELPKNWELVTLGRVAQYGISQKVDSNNEIPEDTWVLDLEDIEKETSKLLQRLTSIERPFQSSKTLFTSSDVLFGKLRPYLNKVIVADSNGVCTTEIVPIRPYLDINSHYIKILLQSPLTMSAVDRLMYGMKMPRLGTDDANKLLFPLPPLAEQKRIVAKVDELMTLCDQLEAHITHTQTLNTHLMDSLIHRMTEAA